MKNKLLDGLIKRMDDLFDQREELFQARYEIQGQQAIWSENETDEERQLGFEIGKVFAAIDKEWGRLTILEKKPEPTLVQANLLS